MSKLAHAQKRTKNRVQNSPAFDFYAGLSAAELARSQRVQPILKVGQLRTFSNPDPKEADWLAREVRRWRRERGPRAAKR